MSQRPITMGATLPLFPLPIGIRSPRRRLNPQHRPVLPRKHTIPNLLLLATLTVGIPRLNKGSEDLTRPHKARV